MQVLLMNIFNRFSSANVALTFIGSHINIYTTYVPMLYTLSFTYTKSAQ